MLWLYTAKIHINTIYFAVCVLTAKVKPFKVLKIVVLHEYNFNLGNINKHCVQI